MSETRFHGSRVTENTDLVTAINDVDSSVIGIVATADDADAKLFPLNKPTLLTRVNDVLGKCGTTGTLYRALKAIADQVSTKVIVVRVAEHKEEDGKTQDQLVIGGSEDDGSYTGMYALLVAEQDESIGYRPRILAAPELDTEAVTKSLCVIAGKLRAFVYASCYGCNTMAEAITYRQKFNEREVMLLWPDFIAYNPKSGKNETFPAPAYACGLRAYIDHEQGWHKSLSNVPVKNVLGMSRHVFWSLQAEDSDANSLNNKEITTIIRRNGFRFWGNRTPETNAYIFEVYNRASPSASRWFFVLQASALSFYFCCFRPAPAVCWRLLVRLRNRLFSGRGKGLQSRVSHLRSGSGALLRAAASVTGPCCPHHSGHGGQRRTLCIIWRALRPACPGR